MKEEKSNSSEIDNKCEEPELTEKDEDYQDISKQEIIHNLRTHEIELENQNEELRKTQLKLESLRDKYFNLFNFAPVGYFTIDKNGIILEANLTGANLLGVEGRRDLIKKSFSCYVAEDYQDVFYSHRKRLFKTSESQVCELKLVKKYGVQFYARLKSSVVKDSEGNFSQFRTAITDITENKQKNEKLEFQANILSQVKDVVIVVDNEERITYLNQAAAEKYNIEQDEVLGYKLTKLYQYKWLKPEHEREAYTSLKEKGYWNGKNIHIKKNGEEIIVESTVSVLKDDSGQNTGMLAVIRDITEQEQIEKTLQRERDKFINILESMKDGVYIINQEYDIEYVNPSLREEFGPFEGMKCYEYIDDRDDVCPWCKNKEVFAGKTVHFERYFSKVQKTYDLIETPMENPDESLSKLEIFRDITERKQMEDLLKETNQLLETILDNTHMLVAYLDTEFNFIRVNSAYAESDNKEPSFFPGKNHFELYPHEENEKIFKRVVETGEPYFVYAKPFEYSEHPERGVTYWDWSLIPIKDEDENVTGLVLTLADITERKQAEEELKRYRDHLEKMVKERTEQLRKANRRLGKIIKEQRETEKEILAYQEQLRNLTYELSRVEERERRRVAEYLHDDIGQTLALSNIMLGEIVKSNSSSEELNQEIEQVRDILGQAIEQTRSLTSELYPTLLYKVGLEGTIESLIEEMQERHDILFEFEDDGESKSIDEEISFILFKAVRELLVNIIKHAQADSARVSIRREDDKIRIDVEDDGIGVDTTKLEANSDENSGFGLFNIQERLDYLGGYLKFESKPNDGTKATLVVPIKKGRKNKD